MKPIQNNCLALVLSPVHPAQRYMEMVHCICIFQPGSVYTGRFGTQTITGENVWLVRNHHGSWFHHGSGLFPLYWDDGEDEMLSRVRPPQPSPQSN